MLTFYDRSFGFQYKSLFIFTRSTPYQNRSISEETYFGDFSVWYYLSSSVLKFYLEYKINKTVFHS